MFKNCAFLESIYDSGSLLTPNKPRRSRGRGRYRCRGPRRRCRRRRHLEF